METALTQGNSCLSLGIPVDDDERVATRWLPTDPEWRIIAYRERSPPFRRVPLVMGSHPLRALRNWPSDAKNYPRSRPRPVYPSDAAARRRQKARGTRPTALEVKTLFAVVKAGRPITAAAVLGISPVTVNGRLRRLAWRAGGGGWLKLVWPVLIEPLRRKVKRLERELAEARETIVLLTEAEDEAA